MIPGRRGSVFILVLWAVTLLSLMAIGLGVAARQKVLVFERLRDREDIRRAAESAIKKAIGVLESQAQDAGFAKSFRYEGETVYTDERCTVTTQVADEENRININLASLSTLQNLFTVIAGLTDKEALKMAEEVVDYRDSDDFVSVYNEGGSEELAYRKAQLPLGPKNGLFETREELLCVKGMTKKMYDLLLNYITIYGSGRLNINTCSREVLMILDIAPDVIDKIIRYRQGPDGIQNTDDDGTFKALSALTAQIETLGEMTEQEKISVTHAVSQNQIDISSRYFQIQGWAQIKNNSSRGVTVCVYGIRDGIKYWSEV